MASSRLGCVTSSAKTLRAYGLAAAVALLAGFAAARWFAPAPAAPALLDLSVVDLEGRNSTLAHWRGRWTLINFWATWCAPCREEIPLLMAVQGQRASQGLRVIGVAIDDAEAVRRYRDDLDIAYPIVIAGVDALHSMAALGNPAGGLPFSVLVGPTGQPGHRKLGAYRPTELDAVLEQAMAAGER